MTVQALLAVFAVAWLGHMAFERVRLERRRSAVPLRIAVTGTRGKTSVTRLLASVLRASGRRVLAKTTGSEAAYVLPDGSEQAVRRRGRPSILEQTRLFERAAKLGVDAVVVEIMSIHAENHRVEAREILRPRIVAVTNFRPDHVEAQGPSPATVGAVLALDVPPGGRAFVPESEWEPGFAERVRREGGTVEAVAAGAAGMGAAGPLAANLDLVAAIARALGIGDDAIRAGVAAARGDIGALGAWRCPRGSAGATWTVVSAFAANDPQSTLRLHDEVLRAHGLAADACIGLLSLRADRGERSLQWADSLAAGALLRFHRLWVRGRHARALLHRLRGAAGAERLAVLPAVEPARTMTLVAAGAPADAWLFGFGNIGGAGAELVRHWRATGGPAGAAV